MVTRLNAYIARQTNRAYIHPFGRGTTALFVALRTLVPDRHGEVILPDIICSTVVDAVILAGLTPVFADVTPDRFAISSETVRAKITPQTRAIIAAHVFGYVHDIGELRQFGLPIIEDAVQGYGGTTPSGKRTGTLGDISVIGFDSTKLVHGRGGVVLIDDSALAKAMECVRLSDAVLAHNVPPYSHYRQQIAPLVESLLCPFNDTVKNVQQITAGIDNLSQIVRERNAKATYLREHLTDLPLHLPPIYSGDAIWRYTFAVASKAIANRILRQFQLAGLPGAKPYPALSTIFAPDVSMLSVNLAPRLISLWVDSNVTYKHLDQLIESIHQI